MEKELSCSNYGLMMEMSTEEQLTTNGYFHTNWENSIDQNEPFESALSSMVSSPTTTPPPSSSAASGCGGDGGLIRELIGRLGTICDASGEVTGYTYYNNNSSSSNNNSCYSTPLNSPPPHSKRFNLSSLMIMANNNLNYPNHNNNNNNLGSINADPGFVERAAKFSCFGNASNFADFGPVSAVNSGNINNNNNNNVRSVPKSESGKLSRVNSEKKMVINHNCNSNNDGGGDSREGSSVSEQNPGVEFPIKPQNDANSRKRKSIPKAKLKDSSTKDDKVEVEKEESDAKRSKVENNNEENKKKENAMECNNKSNKEKENNNVIINDNSKDAAQKTEEPFKDYIHVRARRGQATDSHSLAERVRREKISERMKFLQDLVPGCNKVTGKATVLDEIINYVQSLQRQVEFLSMKLSTVNPRMEFNMESLLSKDMFQSRGSSLNQTMYPLDQNPAHAFPFGYQSTQQMPVPLPNGIDNPFSANPMNAAGIRRHPSIPLPIDGLADSLTQLPAFWEDDLQSLVQMGIVPNQTQSVPGTLPNAQMKVEL